MLTQKLYQVQKRQAFKGRNISIVLIGIATIALIGGLLFRYTATQSTNNTEVLLRYQAGKQPKQAVYPCPQRFNITYIWMRGEMPEIYKQFINRCKATTQLINEDHFKKYLAMWNQKFPQYEIIKPETYPFVLQIEYLKKLHLYFEGGIYADFDTVIDENCWEDVITDRIIFTNYWGTQNNFMLPEQNFIKVPKPFHHRLEQWIIEHIHETRGYSNRWDQCRMEQCFIMLCQTHNYDNSWVGK